MKSITEEYPEELQKQIRMNPEGVIRERIQTKNSRHAFAKKAAQQRRCFS